MAVVLTLVQTKQIRININKRNNTKTQYKQYKYNKYKYTYYQHTHTIVKTPTHYKKKLKQQIVQETSIPYKIFDRRQLNDLFCC